MGSRSGQRVFGGDQIAKALVEHMGIDLGGGDVGVAQHLLHGAQVGAMVQQMGGEGVAQHVRADPRRRYAGLDGQVLEHLAEALARQRPAAAGAELRCDRCGR